MFFHIECCLKVLEEETHGSLSHILHSYFLFKGMLKDNDFFLDTK
jgi:hypothetical protein